MIDFPVSDRDFEEAVRFLCKVMPDANDLPKPTLLHSLRVGVYLFNNNYSRDVCIAGVLHDVIEDADITVKELKEKFGEGVAGIVLANTKNDSLSQHLLYFPKYNAT